MTKRRNRVCRRIAIALTVALLAGQSHAFVLAEENVGDVPQTEISSGETGADVSSNGNVTDDDNGENTNGTEQGGDNEGAIDQNPDDNENKGDQQDDGDGEDKCVCGMKCAEDAVNMDCPICAADYADCAKEAGETVTPLMGENITALADESVETREGEIITHEGIKYVVKEGDRVEVGVQGVNAVSGDITIPGTFEEGGVTYHVTSIGFGAFEKCSDLRNVRILEGVTSIEGQAFEECNSLAGIEIPNSATSIGGAAFRGCSSLNRVRIPENIITIGAYAFVNCRSLNDVELPESVTSIGSEAFAGCSSLTNVKIPRSITNIAESTFYGCSNLSNIELPESVTSIGRNVFRECCNLVSIKIPDSVINIGERAFEDCSSLTDVKISENVTSIGSAAFAGCSSLTSVKIPESVTRIEKGVFLECRKLASVEIPKSVTSIGVSAFGECKSLSGVEIPENVTSIGKYAFAGCSNLIRVKIPEGVKKIEEFTFQSCENLDSVVISENIKEIDRGAFYLCGKLEKIQIVVLSYEDYRFPQIGLSVFDGLPDMKEIFFINGENEEITRQAFIDAFKAAEKADGSNDGKWYGWSYKGVLEGKDTHKVTINAKKDDQPWPFPDCDRIFALSKDGTAFVTDLNDVEAGTYTVYDVTGLTADEFRTKGLNTGVSVTVTDADVSAEVDYYTVTFCDYDAATGETVYGNDTDWKPQTVLKTVGRVAEPATNPTKEGHDFAGWVTAPGRDVKFDFAGTPITAKDTKIYASWTEKTVPVDTYTVTFYDGTQAYGEDTPQKPQKVSAGQKAAKPDAPEKTGWQFAGWKTTDGGSTPYDFDTPVTGTTDIYASWVKETAEQLHITATATEGGDIAPKGDISVTKGGEQTFTITPDEGNRIKTVTVDGKDVTVELKDTLARVQAGARYYTFTNVTENHTIRAEFESDGNTPGGGDNPNPGGGGDNPNPGGGDGGDNPNPGGGGDNPTPGGNEGDNQNPGGGSDTGGSGGGNSGDSGGNSGGGDSAGNGQTAAGSETTSLQAGSGAAGTSASINTASDGSKAADGSASSATGQTANTTGSAVSGSALSASGQTADADGTAADGREPGTGDTAHMEVYATIAMIAGLTYLLLYFMEESRGMTEREKDVFVAAFIRWGKKGGAFRKGCAVVAIFCLLAYYHAIGKHVGQNALNEKYLGQVL